MSKFIGQKIDAPPMLFHAIPGKAMGSFINPSANWGMEILPVERGKLGIGPNDHPPLVFAATQIGKALAFAIEKGQGRLMNATIDSAGAEILIAGDRDNFMSRPREATIYTFPGRDFVELPNAQNQSVSLKAVPFSETKTAIKINNIEDTMRAGLQVFTLKECAEAVYKDQDAAKLTGAKSNKELLEVMGSLIRSGKVVWENARRSVNPNPALAKLLGISANPPKPVQPVRKPRFKP
jgi:hypothetical protein